MTTVVMVGARDGALEAAQRMGLSVYLVTERRPSATLSRPLAGIWVVPFCTPIDALWSGIRARFPDIGSANQAPAAVIALTESAVSVAAALRARWRLPGVDTRTAHVCRDKFAMKRAARSHGITCADFARVGTRTSASNLVQRLGLPLVLKPVDSSGSRGTVNARTFTDVEQNLEAGLLAEAYVHGLEMSVESFVHDGRVVFANPTEYLLPLWANVVPASLSESTLTEVLDLNQRVINSFQIQRGMTHLELFLTSGGPVFGEIALRPPGGYLMDLIERSYGFDPWQCLLDIELGSLPQLVSTARNFNGVWLLHPGQGRVRRVAGCELAQRVSGVELVECHVKAGSLLRPREGSGQSVGRIVASGGSRKDVVNALQLSRRSIVLEVDAPTPQQGSKRGPKAA